MERFIKIHAEKKSTESHLHPRARERLAEYISQGKNVFLSGPPGCGKTTLVNNVIQDTKCLELDIHTIKYYTLFNDGYSHIFIDDFEDENVFRKIVDEVSEGHKKTSGSFIVACSKFYIFPNFENITVEKPTVDEMLSLIDEDDRDKFYTLAMKANGNIHNFIMYMEYPDEKDQFFSTKEYVADILCNLNEINVKSTLHEHGSFWDMIHENYLDSEDSNHEQIINALSLATYYDCLIYEGDWDAMKFFVNEVVSFPKFYLGKPLDKNTIRPGSCWSKQGNNKMRVKKVSDILLKGPYGMHKDNLHLLKLYAQSGNIDILRAYNITAQDFDIVNHLCIKNKLKQRDVNNIKKQLRNG